MISNKIRNCNALYIKISLVIIFTCILVIPIVVGGTHLIPNSEISIVPPEVSNFSKDDYSPILSERKYSLGNISVNDIYLNDLEKGFDVYDTDYPLVGNDVSSGALNITLVDFKFIETIKPAIQDNLDSTISDNNIIKVKLNESLEVQYDNPQAGYLIYHSRLNPCRLLEFYIKNGSNFFELDNETDYNIDDKKFIIFDYEDFFPSLSANNFIIYFIWEYKIALDTWDLFQTQPVDHLIMTATEEIFTVRFNYNFIIEGRKFGEDITQGNYFADEIDLALLVNLPDRNSLNEHYLELNNVSVNINTHLNVNKSIEVLLSDGFSADQSLFNLNFTSDFTLKFIDPIVKTWTIDRLLANINIRERIYLLSIIDGPKHIYLEDLSFYEPTIFLLPNNELISSTSLFDRRVNVIYMNFTLTGREGIRIIAPYLIANETCPIIIKYYSTQTLHVVVTDNIRMPLVGATAELFYYSELYGTYISIDKVQPIPIGSTNENGVILLKNVPHGNYTMRIYMNGIFLKESLVSPDTNINYIYTDYPHFPFWIIIFAIINGIILIIGLGFYLKYKKMR
ncbi:MAG: hypothetical protein JSV62_06395 [Promethearchaeota archaeon]|nr:MAG: hypothetical protein JSV62_06395 [Candidatus Lokiarchaeota archaeon]